MSHSDISGQLKLLQLADSGLPIGGLAHSFGLETLIDEQLITVDDLFPYLANLLEESLLLEAAYCREGYACAVSEQPLVMLNDNLSALRIARESRDASLALGKRFLRLVASLDSSPLLQTASAIGEIHFSIAFGHACGVFGFQIDQSIAAFLHQNVVAALSAAQRLLSLGQTQSSRMAWELKPFITQAVCRSAELNIASVSTFSHLPELASMRHPCLSTRLFIS